MKICSIQQPYPYTPDEAPAAVQFVIDELNSCDETIDLIVTPEYTNCPTKFPLGESLPFAIAHTPELVEAAVNAAKRCHAVVALSFCAEVNGVYRNTTRIYDTNGNVAGDYYKQQLTEKEPAARQVDNSYALDYLPPAIVEVDGVRYGFVTCYDAYYEEYIEHLAYRKPDVVLVCSHQRGERFDVLEFLNCSLAFHTNAFVVRSSVGMGEGITSGGCTMVVDPSGKLLANAKSQNGNLICDVEDIHWKYQRTDSFKGAMINNDWFIEKGRTPWSYRPAGSSVRLDDRRMPYPRICAHRGFSQVAPENTLPAFGAAIALGADEIEFDLWQTRDGVPVVMHDPTLERVSNGSGDITEKTLAELKALDFGGKFNPAFAGLKIATFEEVLKRFPRQAIFNIHIKSSGTDDIDRDYLRKIVQLIRDYDCLNHVYITGRADLMEAMLEVAPEIPRCMGAGPDPSKMDVVEKAIKYQCAKLQFMKPYLNKEMVEKAHANGIVCNVFWSDDPAETAEYLALGVDTILSNHYWQNAQVVHPQLLV
ncbi:MAG: hypothetical protein IJW17_13520 [Lentisphaeria bacterium]|nr:hypothetical protein [Lentisphaeria bacterium]